MTVTRASCAAMAMVFALVACGGGGDGGSAALAPAAPLPAPITGAEPTQSPGEPTPAPVSGGIEPSAVPSAPGAAVTPPASSPPIPRPPVPVAQTPEPVPAAPESTPVPIAPAPTPEPHAPTPNPAPQPQPTAPVVPRTPAADGGQNAKFTILTALPFAATAVETNRRPSAFFVVASEPIDEKNFYFVLSDAANPDNFRTRFRMPNSTTFSIETWLGGKPPGVYSGTAILRICRDTSYPKCLNEFPDSPKPFPYTLTVSEFQTSFLTREGEVRALHPQQQGVGVAMISVDGTIWEDASFNVEVSAGAPFVSAHAFRTSVDGFSFSVGVAPNLPPGRLTGNLFVKICRDATAICAFPHNGSPFNLPIVVNVK